jgi:hypothetical protein
MIFILIKQIVYKCTKFSTSFLLLSLMFYSLDELKPINKTKNQIFVVVDISNLLTRGQENLFPTCPHIQSV